VAATQWTDRWIRGVLPLGALHVALTLTLRARPGSLGPSLFTWGPLLLVLFAASLLGAALWSAIRGGATWTLRRGAGLLGLVAVVGTMGVYGTYPSSYDFVPSAVDFRLPLDGPITVAWGGPTAAVNYHVASPGERWGYDLLVTAEGRTFHTNGRTPADYHAYGRRVLAPADGRVIRVRDGVPDAPPGRPDRWSGAGNHVVIEVAPREYLFVAHLRAGSLRVAEGQTVRQGEVIGTVGNSGHSTEPHVHLHLQDSPRADSGEGIPLRFSDARLYGSDPPVPRPMPTGGTRGARYVGDVIVSDPGH
jgi:murein DD-endopeptidase MepM/ murein hydrolase activator NlpD